MPSGVISNHDFFTDNKVETLSIGCLIELTCNFPITITTSNCYGSSIPPLKGDSWWPRTLHDDCSVDCFFLIPGCLSHQSTSILLLSWHIIARYQSCPLYGLHNYLATPQIFAVCSVAEGWWQYLHEGLFCYCCNFHILNFHFGYGCCDWQFMAFLILMVGGQSKLTVWVYLHITKL